MTARAVLGEIIAQEGPITVERYMGFCAADPVYGYYSTRDPFGAAGDFTTAPEISQMFGELIGLWAAEVWTAMGRPSPIRLVELGPGRGTLMADALRAARALPGFLDAADIHLVETSATLRAAQRERLRDAGVALAWHGLLDEVPGGPAIVIANEFFDALPVRQYVATGRGWCERLVGLGTDGGLAFGLAAEPEAALTVPARPGAVLEVAAAAIRTVRGLAGRLRDHRSAALIIDYGYEGPRFGDTLQAVARHAPVDPLADPGEADLTVHVDFAALSRAAREGGVTVHGPVRQRDFLLALGIEARAARLQARATGPQREAVQAALDRLTGTHKGGMGGLFRALALTHPALPVPPGFEAGAPSTRDPALPRAS